MTPDAEKQDVSVEAEHHIRSLGPGQPLPASERAFFEPRFGADFSSVRVHSGTRADAAAESVSARAFALGSDVVFGEGEFRPGSAEGRRLIAHELTHTVQQRAVHQGAPRQSEGGSRGHAPLGSEGATQRRVQRRGAKPTGPVPTNEGDRATYLAELKKLNDPRYRPAVIDLLDKGQAAGVGAAQSYELAPGAEPDGLQPIDRATLHQADVLTAAAEADARLYKEELQQADIDLQAARKALRKNRWKALGAGLRRQREQRLGLKAQRPALRAVRDEARGRRQSLRGQEELRGHRVEFVSTLVETSAGFGFTQPIPGHQKINVDRDTGAFTQPSMHEAMPEERGVVGIEGEPVGEIHSHPISGDPKQTAKVPSQEGLKPSATDRRTANKNPLRQVMVNPRGEVIHIGAKGAPDRSLRPGISEGEIGRAKEAGPAAEGRQRLGGSNFETLVQQQLKILRSLDRQALVDMQRLER